MGIGEDKASSVSVTVGSSVRMAAVITLFSYHNSSLFLTLYFLLTLILRRSHTGTVWFYTSTSNKRAARPKLYTKSLTRDLKLMYSLLTLVRVDNIRMDLQEVCCGHVDWIGLAQDRDGWRKVVNTIMNIRVP